MIQLSIQIKMIVFSFIFGFLFSIFLDLLYIIGCRLKKLYQILLNFIIIILSSLIYFIGITKISNGIFHVYSIICLIFGFITYDIIVKRLANKYKK